MGFVLYAHGDSHEWRVRKDAVPKCMKADLDPTFGCAHYRRTA